MGKRGSGHLEMIMAFSIFLIAVVFLLVYLRPLETTKLSDIAVISLKSEFVEYTSTELIVVFINSSEPCLPAGNLSPPILSLNSTSQDLGANNYYLLFSDEFSGNLSTCTNQIGIGSPTRKNLLSSKKLNETQEKYYSNYSGLKQDLKIPKVLNFEIIGGDINLSRETVEGIDIIAKRYTFGVLNENGTQINQEFTFRVW